MKNFLRIHLLPLVIEFALLAFFAWAFADALNEARDPEYALNALDGFVLLYAPVAFIAVLARGSFYHWSQRAKAGDRSFLEVSISQSGDKDTRA